MISNPELRRNLWLELTPHRLVSAPIILILLFSLLISLRTDYWHYPVALTAVAIFFVVTLIWGGRQTHDSIVDEVRDHTWDTQRMSAISPWTMTSGKLMGSTLFNWYVGAMSLAIFAFTYDSTTAVRFNHWTNFSLCMVLVFEALWVQAAGLLSGLITARAGRNIKPVHSLPVTVLGAIVFVSMGREMLAPAAETVRWFGLLWDRNEFLLASLVVFTGWTWLGAYRLMSEMLAVRIIPWVALSFVVLLTLYFGGFFFASEWEGSWTFPAIGTAMGVAASYVMAWKERRDWIAVSRFIRTWKDEHGRHALEATPAWIPVAFFAFACAIATAVLLPALPAPPVMRGAPWNWIFAAPITFVVLMFRDIGLLYFFSLGQRPERANSTALVYLALLYGVLPALLNLADLGFLAYPLLIPQGLGPFWLAPLIASVHLTTVIVLIMQRLSGYRSVAGQGDSG